jgi:hypothetical protein
MASPLHTIILAMSGALQTWASAQTVPGTVEIAPDEVAGYAALGLAPNGWKLVMWTTGDGADLGQGRVDSKIRVGFACARGMALKTDREVVEGRATLPAVIELIEACNMALRGLYYGAPGAVAADAGNSCFALKFMGWKWVRFETGADHHTAELDYALARQLPERTPLNFLLT